MAKHKVSELEGARLDAAVATAESKPGEIYKDRFGHLVYGPTNFDAGELWSPSTDWAIGGPIIERERIQLVPDTNGNGDWCASHWGDVMDRKLEKTARCLESVQVGPAPLIAAMRAYCASVFGEEVELP